MTSKQDTTKLAIKYKPIGDLVPYARNSRTHSESQVAQIAASIKEFGWTNPVLLDGENGIIAGHGRVMAAQKLGEKQVPTIELGHLDEHQKRAYIIADNKLALNAGWDDEMLSLEISDLKDAGYDLRFTGFTQDEINQLGDEPTEGLTDEDAIPEVKDEPKTKHGNIYQLGDHILMCGDSTNEKDVAKLVSYFGDEHKHCISDPPYGIAYDPKTVKYGMIKNDDVFLDYIGLAKKYTNGFFFMWTSYQVVDEWINRVNKTSKKSPTSSSGTKAAAEWATACEHWPQTMR